MCGIAGVFDFRGVPPPLATLREMADAIAHRGPDDEGFHQDRGVALAFKRLAIIDLAGGRQPMTSAGGRYTIVFNGEIYNHPDLRAELERDHDCRFRTRSDTEAILEGWRVWGDGLLGRLNGMFAFAVWDAAERTLTLVRDRLGKKPLFYAEVPGGFCFASEVKALLRHPGTRSEVDRGRVLTFLTYRYVPGEETLFEGIRCVPAGGTILVREAGVGEPRKYWDYAFADDVAPRPPEQLESELRELLESAVKLRLVADVPVGAFLSGGIDSSIVVAMMSRLHPEPLKTFSVGFRTGLSEAGHARAVAERFGTDHHEITVGSDELIAEMPRVLAARETPITEASDIPIYLLSRRAREEVTVVLSGEGSDEVLAGYPKYAFARAWGRLDGMLPRPVVAATAAVLPFGLRRAQLALESVAEPDRFERYCRWFGGFGPAQRRELLHPSMLREDGLHEFSRQALSGRRWPSPVEEMLYLDTRAWLPANLLLRGDRMTMANSLELRCPFLDYRIVEFAATRIPLDLKVHRGTGKWILRRLARAFLPESIRRRRKWGFKVPLTQWFRGPLLPLLEDVVLSPRAIGRGYFRPDALRRIVDAHRDGRVDYEKQLWILLQLELWHLMFVDQTISPTDALLAAAPVAP